MKQREAVVQTIEKLWWIATLWEINHHIFEITDCIRNTKTPFASVRRIVQTNPKEIYKIKPWLYSLVKYKNENEKKWIFESDNTKEWQLFSHYYYQWLLVEIWNMENFQTYIPPQDQNQYFLKQKLWELTSIQKMYNFWYEDLIKRARTIDVIRFNNRDMPDHFYEVEHSTDIQNSLLKFTELQDFNSKFTIVADKIRKKEYEAKIQQLAFNTIKNRVTFLDYEQLSQYHTKAYEYYTTKNNIKQIFC